jgi:signal transduction histidine kinase
MASAADLEGRYRTFLCRLLVAEARSEYQFAALRHRELSGIGEAVTGTERSGVHAAQCVLVGGERCGQGVASAGVAHEINTPIPFVGDNTRFLRDAFGDLAKLLEQSEILYQAIRGGVHQPALEAVDAAREQADLEFVRAEIPVALAHTLDGIGRVATIVRALKSFSHVGEGEEKMASDINSALESTIVMARSELKLVADVETAFGDLPQVVCHLGDLNQVFLNLMLNAAHSIGDVVEGTDKKGRIRVETHVDCTADGEWAEVSISDTGTGIPEGVRGASSSRSLLPSLWARERDKAWRWPAAWWWRSTAAP